MGSLENKLHIPNHVRRHGGSGKTAKFVNKIKILVPRFGHDGQLEVLGKLADNVIYAGDSNGANAKQLLLTRIARSAIDQSRFHHSQQPEPSPKGQRQWPYLECNRLPLVLCQGLPAAPESPANTAARN